MGVWLVRLDAERQSPRDEMVDVLDLESSVARRGGSNPSVGTN